MRVILRTLIDGLEVSVGDNGPGIRPEDHELIFEKFRQVGDTMTAKPSGTGLGLPISRRIVEHFGGKLWVESVPGAGAVSYTQLAVYKRQGSGCAGGAKWCGKSRMLRTVAPRKA